jgi:hypothetical protein
MTTQAVSVDRDPRALAALVGRWAVRILGVVSLAGSVGLSLWLVLAATERPSVLSGPAKQAHFAGWIVGPLAHRLPGFTTDRARIGHDLLVVLIALFVCWIVASICVNRLHVAWVAGALGLVGVVFFLSPPLSLTDLFNYLHYGRMGAVQGLNPYSVLPVSSPHDGWYALSNWHHLPSPYGPLFTLVTYPLALLPLHAAYWTWKGLVMVAEFGMLAIVWWLAPRMGRSPQRALAFVGLNPLVLVYGLGGAHNEPLVMLAVMASVALIVRGAQPAAARGWSVGAGAAIAGGAALKLSMAALAPLIVLGSERRRASAAGVAIAGVVALAVVGLVFGGHTPAVGLQQRLVTPLSVPQFFGWLAGQGGLSPLVRTICRVALASAVVGACVAVWLRRSLLIGACGTVMLVAILTLGWTMPWYVWWVLPFAALARTRWLTAAAIIMTLWLGLGAIPQMPKIIHHFGYVPGHTAIGRANHRLTERILK